MSDEITVTYAVPPPVPLPSSSPSVTQVCRVNDLQSQPASSQIQVVTPGGQELFSGIVQNLNTTAVHLNFETDGGVGPQITVGPGAFLTFTNVCLISVRNQEAMTIEVLGIIQVYQNLTDYNDACKQATIGLPNSLGASGSSLARSAFYDRNAITTGKYAFGVYTEPYAAGILASYTVPANRKALIMSGSCLLQRLTQSTTITLGNAFVATLTNSAYLLNTAIQDPTLYTTRIQSIGQSTVIPAIDGLAIWLELGIGGGTFLLAVEFSVCEFDQ